MSSGRPIAVNKLAETREAKCFPKSEITGTPAQRLSEVVVWPLQMKVSRERLDRSKRLRCRRCAKDAEKIILLVLTLSDFAFAQIFFLAVSLSSSSQRMPFGTLFKIFIQEVKVFSSIL